MFNYFSLDQIFSACAWVATPFYLLRILLSFIGFSDGDSADTLGDHSSDDAFKFLSLNALIGFLMMFGWGGLTAHRQFSLNNLISVSVALSSGLLFLGLTRSIFKVARALTSTGSTFDIQSALGKQAMVYQKIEVGEQGVIQISLHDLTHQLHARSNDNQVINSFKTVEIIQVIDHQTVLVKRVK